MFDTTVSTAAATTVSTAAVTAVSTAEGAAAGRSVGGAGPAARSAWRWVAPASISVDGDGFDEWFDLLIEAEDCVAEELTARFAAGEDPLGQAPERDSIVAGLDEMAPGPELAAFLASVDVSRLSGHDRVLVLRAQRRMESHYAAGVCETISAVSDVFSEEDDDFELATLATEAEIRAALRLTRRAADASLSLAWALTRRLPRVWQALRRGDIDLSRARVLAHGTEHLSKDAAGRVVDEIVAEAAGLTTGQLAARLRRLCLKVDPEDAVRRYQKTVQERRVVCEPTSDGAANLVGLDLPPDRAAAALDHINHLARRLRAEGETRTMDQLRADVFLDLLCGTADANRSRRGTVNLHVDLLTLTRLVDHPGELAGFGPVIADIARQVAEHQADAEWRWVLTDPEAARPIAGGVTRRRPTTPQRRQVQLRDPVCVFPGCRMPATDSDLDHRIPYAQGGPTHPDSLAPLCRHDHCHRHRGWSYQPLANGDYQWTSPLGHRYTTSGAPP